MELDPKSAGRIAQSYLGTTAELVRLGWGISGFVYLSPDGRTAVKVHRYDESFAREAEAYERLRRFRITELHGLAIPTLHDYRRDLKVIRMDVVSAPYLLDFAGVTFSPPDFSEDTMQQWHTGIAEMFGPNAYVAYAVYHSLARRGIYYMDFRPSNLKLEGLPGLEPFAPPDSDEV
jgi:hypothetical protein